MSAKTLAVSKSWPPPKKSDNRSALGPTSVRVGNYPYIKSVGCGLLARGQTDNRVFNGTAALPGDSPWLGAMVEMLPPRPPDKQWFPYFICGANIIGDYWVVTARHCLHPTDEKGIPFNVRYENFRFFFGTLQRFSSDHTYALDYFVDHREFDISVVKVRTKINPVIDGNRYLVNYACLPVTEQLNSGAEEAMFAGWGRTDNTNLDTPFHLNKVKITISPPLDCKQYLEYPKNNPSDYDYYVCAKVEQTMSCSGDSGSGLIQFDGERAVLIGVVREHGPKPDECQPPGYILFTRVSMFTNWIQDIIKADTNEIDDKRPDKGSSESLPTDKGSSEEGSSLANWTVNRNNLLFLTSIAIVLLQFTAYLS